jgi:Flp pilus assembly protein TadD
MIKKYLLLVIIVFIFNNIAYGAAGNNGYDGDSKYKKGSSLIKSAKKLEKKGKLEKAKKKYKKAIEYLILANKKKPNDPDTLNYLGYASRKIGNLEIAEKYYLEGLTLDPKHIGINEYLGELYIITKRIDKAKKRLEILKNCDCEEFEELKTLIEQQ